MYKYFLTREGQPEVEVTKEVFVRAERNAGLYNTMGQPSEPATSGFISNRKGEEKVCGRIV